MRTFDYIYDEILYPFAETMIDFGKFIATILLTLILLVSFPIWIIPYFIVKSRRKGGE